MTYRQFFFLTKSQELLQSQSISPQVVYEHTVEWHFSAESMQWLRLIFGPVLVCTIVECVLWLFLGTPTTPTSSPPSLLSRVLSLVSTPIRALRNFVLRPLSLLSGLRELFQPPRASENFGFMVVRIWLTVVVVSVHTIEAFEWEMQDSSRSFLEIE